jgi:hypothetical protein
MIEHSIVKLRQLLESDASLRRLEREWKRQDTQGSLAKYLLALLRSGGKDRYEIESEDGERHVYIDIDKPPAISWQVIVGSHSTSGSGPDVAVEVRSIVRYFYGLQR